MSRVLGILVLIFKVKALADEIVHPVYKVLAISMFQLLVVWEADMGFRCTCIVRHTSKYFFFASTIYSLSKGPTRSVFFTSLFLS